MLIKSYLITNDEITKSTSTLNYNVICLITEIMKASQQAIERGVKDCVFIDYKRRSGHFDVTTVASIKEITEKVNNLILEKFIFI